MACGPFDPHYFDPNYFDVCREFRFRVEGESAPGVWTDITEDVIDHTSLRARRGGLEWSPTAAVQRPGTMTFTLNNDARTGGAVGRYTPGHVNQLPWFKFGTRVRLFLSFGSFERYVWRGKLLTPQPEPDLAGPRIVHCAASDYMAYFANQDAINLELLEHVRYDEALQALIDVMPEQPAHVELGAGSETFTFAFDDLGSRAPKALQVAHDLLLSDGGLLVLRGDEDEGETLRSYSRAELIAAESVFALTEAQLLKEPGNPSIASGPDFVVNEIDVLTVHRRADVAPTTLLVAMDRPVKVPAGQTVTFFADYRDPNSEETFVGGKDIQAMVAYTDFTANSDEEGDGVDLTPYVTVVATGGGSRCEFAATNTSPQDGWLRGPGSESGPQCRGIGLYRFAPTLSRTESAGSIADHGRLPLASAMVLPYQTSATIGQAIGEWKAYLFGRTPNARRIALFTPDPDVMEMAITGDIGDKGTVSESMTALAGAQVVIAGIDLEIVRGGHLRMAWELIPSDDTEGMVFDDPVRGTFDNNVFAHG